MPLYFSGYLTDTRTGRRRKVKLTADAYGFWAGTNFARGCVEVYVVFRSYFLDGGPSFTYNTRKPAESEGPLHLSLKPATAPE